jgi:hypothetical protein
MGIKTRLGYLATLAAGVAIGLAVVGTATSAFAAAASAAAAKAPAAKAPAAKAPAVKMVTHHYALAASAFAPDGLHNTAEDYFNSWDPSTLNNQDAGRCFNAGLSLPVGATLKSVTAYYTAGTSVMYFEVNRQDLINHTSSQVVSFDTAVASTSTYTSTKKSVPSVYAAVDMTDYAYSAGVCPSGTTTFTGLIIAYTVPAS